MNYIQNIISKITLALMGEGRGVGLLIMCICVFLPQMAQADELPDVVIGQEAVSSLQNKTYVFKNKVEGVWLTVTNDGKLSVTDTQPVSSASSTYRSQYFTVTDGAINYSLIDANDPSSGITISDETADIEFVKRRKTEAAQPTVRILDKNNRYVMYVGGKLASISTTHPNTEWYAYEVEAVDHVANGYDKGFGTCERCHAGCFEKPNQLNDGTYEIANAGQLYWFADKVNNDNANYKKSKAKLTKDIVVNEGTFDDNGKWSETGTPRSWTPIGKGYVMSNSSWYDFWGTFDGDGHTISGLYFNNSSTSYVGLFGSTNEATINNVGVVNAYFKGGYGVGGVCGYNNNSTITNCYATGKVSGESTVGGVCGYNYYSTITNCYATGTVSGDYDVGGVCGYNNSDSSISNCYATGTVSGTYDYVGGVCGYNGYSTITGCYATGTVSGTGDAVGGVCGYSSQNSTITNCYATGTVSGSRYVGGVCGYNEANSTITNCYATAAVSGKYYVGGVCGSNSNSTITNCYTKQATAVGLSDSSTETNVEGGVTEERFHSGEIAWLLNGSVDNDGNWKAGQTNGSQAWYQTIDGDDYPVLTKASDGSNTVYYDAERTPAYYNLAIVPGDLNADGVITIADLTLLVEILNGRATDTNGTADVDGNGSITTEDANALRNKILEVK